MSEHNQDAGSADGETVSAEVTRAIVRAAIEHAQLSVSALAYMSAIGRVVPDAEAAIEPMRADLRRSTAKLIDALSLALPEEDRVPGLQAIDEFGASILEDAGPMMTALTEAIEARKAADLAA